jgi:hypothetical protein
MKQWIVTGRKYFSKAFEVVVDAETPHDASVMARSPLLLPAFMPEQAEYTDIVIVKEKK